ncbi:EAL domain-containing protein [Alphaproteobacteria bacterium]|nr:EAL domain-containing protein [Alphaproteobacteria bacterium]
MQWSIIMLNQFKELGIKISVDNLGQGYSPLSYLQTFLIDTLNIDISFIINTSRNYQKLVIVRPITMLTHNIRLDAISEGVEIPEQLAQLRALGYYFAQGFHCSRPVDVEKATRLIQEDRCW